MTYESSDLYFAALLHACGHKLAGTRRDGKRMYFIYEPSEEIEELHLDWLNEEGSVVPSVYAESIRKLKALTFNA